MSYTFSQHSNVCQYIQPQCTQISYSVIFLLHQHLAIATVAYPKVANSCTSFSSCSIFHVDRAPPSSAETIRLPAREVLMSVIAFLWTRLPSIWATSFVSSGMWKILMLPLLLPAHYNITFRLTLLSSTYVVIYICYTKVQTFYICMLYYFKARAHTQICTTVIVHDA